MHPLVQHMLDLGKIGALPVTNLIAKIGTRCAMQGMERH